LERLDFTLLTDGSSDAILIRPLTWLLRQHLACPIDGTWADLRRLSDPPKDLRTRIEAALDLYPCDLLFVHRDAERESHEERLREILAAVSGREGPVIPVVPIRMQEAWLLLDEAALRRAAGNPGGRFPLEMPSIDRLEAVPDPKDMLHRLLLDASGLPGRRRQKLKPGRMALRLGELIEDYGSLRRLSAFQNAEHALVSALAGWA
jgi:hypothetical protein